jgi:hypothetical protein
VHIQDDTLNRGWFASASKCGVPSLPPSGRAVYAAGNVTKNMMMILGSQGKGKGKGKGSGV